MSPSAVARSLQMRLFCAPTARNQRAEPTLAGVEFIHPRAARPRTRSDLPAWSVLLTHSHSELSVIFRRWAGLVLLIVMYGLQTWRMRPGEPFTFGRAPACSAVLPALDRGVSRHAGSLRYHGGCWWLHNDSSSAML
jgi:hypothetical protein